MMGSASLARSARRFASATTPPGAFWRERLAAWRHALHRQPELGFDLFKTSQFVADTLASFGGDMDITRGLGGTGVVASLRGGAGTSGRGIALRADMDALPIFEEADVPYRSEVDGVAHLCGHDGHTAMLLGAAEHLVSVAETLDGTVHFVFQPAEEAGGGGEVVVMVKDGLFRDVAADATAVYGLHNWPRAISKTLRPGGFAATAGPVMAGADEFEMVITGRGGHAAMPHVCVDPVLAGAQVVVALQALVSRSTSPLDSVVVSVTCFDAGEAVNAIPETATLKGTVRTFDEAVRKRVKVQLLDTAAAVAGRAAVVALVDGYPPTINGADETAFAAACAARVVGADNVVFDEPPSMGAEDFSYLLHERPGARLARRRLHRATTEAWPTTRR
ncbi:IAA-amino acid conjugate hydrolase [Aureococcus anophagefferens]|nr:IAA-amino acid conjugate hydrolase [Aureococcus anophagefferens]